MGFVDYSCCCNDFSERLLKLINYHGKWKQEEPLVEASELATRCLSS